MLHENSLSSLTMASITIREKFRSQKRAQCIQRSFRTKRLQLLQKQRSEIRFKRHQESQNKKQQVFAEQLYIRKQNVKLQYQNYLVYNEMIGSGTYSKVYLGYNMITNKKVAIKEVSELEKNEINVLMSVDSPFIIRLEFHWKNLALNLTYLVLDLCERNLRQQMERGISIEMKLKYFDHVVQGMDILFAKNIIHRDLKFENILVSKEGIAKITDFGLAKDMGTMSNVASLRCGTPYTMAPEVFFHNSYTRPTYNQKCDIWSIGVILHEILYNRHPFNYKSELMMKDSRVQINKSFGFLDLLIDRALVRNICQRICWKQFKHIYDSKGQTMERNRFGIMTPPLLNVDPKNRKQNMVLRHMFDDVSELKMKQKQEQKKVCGIFEQKIYGNNDKIDDVEGKVLKYYRQQQIMVDQKQQPFQKQNQHHLQYELNSTQFHYQKNYTNHISRFNKNNKICEAKPSKKQPQIQRLFINPLLQNTANDFRRQKVFQKEQEQKKPTFENHNLINLNKSGLGGQKKRLKPLVPADIFYAHRKQQKIKQKQAMINVPYSGKEESLDYPQFFLKGLFLLVVMMIFSMILKRWDDFY